MKKRNQLLMTSLLLLLLLTGCGSKSANDISTPQTNSASGGAAPMEQAVTEESAASYLEMEGEMDMAAAESKESLSGSAGVSSTGNVTAQKLIKDVNISAETKNFDELFENLVTKVNTIGGYIETSQVNGNSYQYSQFKSGYLVARIPSENLDQFVKVVKDSANITSKSESTRDVTLQYVDMKSHVSALRAEQESLFKILEAATKLEDIIKIQSQLTQVRYEIESYESQLRTFDNLVTYSTVSIHVEEVDRETKVETKTFGEELSTKLNENLYDIKEGALNFIIWFLSSIPYLIMWAVFIACIIILIKKIGKKVKQKKGKFNHKSNSMNHINNGFVEDETTKKKEKEDLE